MSLDSAEMLGRIAKTLRSDIGPAVGDEYTRTQAFMAAVILERIGRQVDLGPDHATAEQRDLVELFDDLHPMFEATPDPVPDFVVEAVATAKGAGDVAALTDLVETLYRWGADEPAAAAALDRIRVVLRRDIDRRMEIAR